MRFNIEIAISYNGEGAQRAREAMRTVADESKRAADGVEGITGKLGELKSRILELVGVMGAGLGLEKIIADTSRQQAVMAQLDVAVKGLGATSSLTRESLLSLAEQVEATTTVSKTSALAAIDLGLTYTDISARVFPKVVTVAGDLAARMALLHGGNVDLSASMQMLAKAVDQPATGMTMLRRAWVVLNETQKEAIKTLADTGHQLEAQKLLLADVAEKVQGSAAAYRNTLGGSLDLLKNSFEEFAETVGNAASPAIRAFAEELGKTAADGHTLAQELGEALGSAVHVLGEALAFASEHSGAVRLALSVLIGLKVAAWVIEINEALAALNLTMAANPFGLVVKLLVAAGLGVNSLINQWKASLEPLTTLDGQLLKHRDLLKELTEGTDKLTEAQRKQAEEMIADLRAQAAVATAEAQKAYQEAAKYPSAEQQTARGIPASAQTTGFEDYYKKGQEAENTAKMLAFQADQAAAALTRHGKAAEDAGNKLGALGQQQRAALEALAAYIEKLKQQASASAGMVAATALGVDAVRAETREQAIASAILEETLKLKTVHLTLSADAAAAIRREVGAIEDNKVALEKLKVVLADVQKLWEGSIEFLAKLGTAEQQYLAAKSIDDYQNALRQIDVQLSALNQELPRLVQGSDAYRQAVAAINDLETKRAEIIGRMPELYDAFRNSAKRQADEETATLDQVLDRLNKETAAYQSGGAVAASALQQVLGLHDQILQIVSQSVHVIAGPDAAADFAARWLAAVHQVGDALTANFNAQKSAEIFKPLDDAWQGFLQDGENALNQLLETGSASFADLGKSLLDTFLKTFEQIFQNWIKLQIEMAATRAAINAETGTSGVGPVANAGQYGQLLSGGSTGGLAGLWGSAGTAGVAGSGSGFSGALMGTGAWGAAGSVLAWVGILAAFAIAVNKLNAHIQATGESVINLGKSLDITTPKADGHIASLEAYGKQVAEQIQQFFITYGGIFESLDSSIAVKRRGQGSNTQWKVYVDGIVTSFGKDMQAALDYATIEAIKHSSEIGLDPLVVAAIKDYAGKSLDEFQKEIEFAQRLATQNLPGISGQLASAASQYFADLHQAQVQFKGDTEALNSAVQSIVQKFTDTVQALKNSVLGIDTSTSDFLAGIVGFQSQMAKTGQEVAAQLQKQIDDTEGQIAQMGKGPRPGVVNGDNGSGDRASDQADWNARLQQLKDNVEKYKEELANIPKALSDTEVNMAIFDSLYKYLQGSKKYAEQAAEYAKMKVEIEFDLIKLQLIALGKWEEFAGMWQDALTAAEKATLNQARARPSAAGGTSPADERKTLEAQIATLRAAAQGSVHTAYLDLSNSIADFVKNAKAAKLPAAELADAIDLMTKKFQADLLAQAQGYAGIGTDFTSRLKGVTDFFHELEDLGRAKTGIPDWLERILKGDALKKLGDELDASLDQFNGLVDPMVAINQQADTLRQNILAYGQAMGLTADQIRAMLDKVAAGVDFQKQSAVNGIMDTLFGYLKDDQRYASQATELKREEIDLQFRLIEAQLEALGAWDDATQKIFDAAKAAADEQALGGTGPNPNNLAQLVAQQQQSAANTLKQAADAFAASTQKLIDYQKSLLLDTGLTTLTPKEQRAEALSQLQAVFAQAQAGSVDARNNFQQQAQAFLQADRAYNASNGTYSFDFGMVQRMLRDLIGQAGPAAPAPVTAPAMFYAPIVDSVNNHARQNERDAQTQQEQMRMLFEEAQRLRATIEQAQRQGPQGLAGRR